MGAVLVYITAADAGQAGEIARGVVGRRLAACANVVPKITSTYWWDGKVAEAGESLIFIKTTRARVPDLIRSVKEMHSYTVPAVTVIDIEDGNPEYLRWIESEVR